MKSIRKGLNFGGIALSLLLTGCSTASHTRVEEVQVEGQTYTKTAPGVVEYVWEEPMVDVIEVPPGLDPEGHYYRPAHHEVVEIREGRWQYYRPEGKK